MVERPGCAVKAAPLWPSGLGLTLAGWVANRIDPDMTFPDENIASIREHLAREYDAPLLGIVPHLTPALPEFAAEQLDINRLLQTLRHAQR